MIKFIVKCVIVLLALQSAMDYFRKEAIISGSIEINYPVIQQKLVAAISIRHIAAGLVEFTMNKIQGAANHEIQRNFQVCRDQFVEKAPRFKIIEHVVEHGETLNELSQRYGVHLLVIQRVNHLHTDYKIFVGQKLKIPSKTHELI